VSALSSSRHALENPILAPRHAAAIGAADYPSAIDKLAWDSPYTRRVFRPQRQLVIPRNVRIGLRIGLFIEDFVKLLHLHHRYSIVIAKVCFDTPPVLA